VHAVMCEHAQTTLTMMTYEADGHAFLQRMGAQQKISNIESRLRCDGLDEPQLAACEQVAMASHQGLALQAYRGRVPSGTRASRSALGSSSPVFAASGAAVGSRNA